MAREVREVKKIRESTPKTNLKKPKETPNHTPENKQSEEMSSEVDKIENELLNASEEENDESETPSTANGSGPLYPSDEDMEE